MEFSLTNPKTKERFGFTTRTALFAFIEERGEIDGWILHIHYM